MRKEVEKKDEVVEELSCANEELKSYINCLSKSEGIAYQGKKVSEVKKKRTTLKCFISQARIALWFAESFGLDICSMNVVEKCTGTVHTVSLADTKTMPIILDDKNANALSAKGNNSLAVVKREEKQPLLHIDLDHVVVDELYLMLRIVDVLIDNLIEEVLQWDKMEDLRKK
ncbi:Hypothetical predicted protein [Paramuricea clavata]|uniref:Uncharacterized protein n=1 Tax=Paramuricea clavata TaxID=317549 RepID=A0A7D9DE15_PARCT|nr:Hypothetical predicted protein [Paramuricea clavata]